jgi:hypothetical protein
MTSLCIYTCPSSRHRHQQSNRRAASRGYTAVTEAVKRAASLLAYNKKLKERVSRLLIDI